MKTTSISNSAVEASDFRGGERQQADPASTADSRLLAKLRKAVWVPAALMLALLSGCLEEHLVWSPDGKRAAVIEKDGLHLCDPAGKLTPLLVPGANHAAWLSDSQRLAVACTRNVGDWATISQVLGRDRAAAVAAEAKGIWDKLAAGGRWGALTSGFGENNHQSLVKLLLRERHADALRGKLSAADWEGLKAEHVELANLLIARIDGDRVIPGPVLHEGLEKISDIRVSPGDRAIAFTTDLAQDNDDESRLFVARVDAPGVTTVAERTAAYPAWTSDARSLVYVQAAEGGKKDVRLATLVRREVFDARGMIALQEKPDDMAGMIFSNLIRVRCLKDGRILFNAVEFNLPMSTKDIDAEREKLFVVDSARQSTLVRLIPRGEEENMPKNLTFFEPSPDEQRVLVGGFDGEVSILTIATGEVQKLQKAGEYNLMAAPAWRNNEEISYARRNPTENGKPPARKAEIILEKPSPAKGDHEIVLSQEWSVDTLESVFSEADKK
jgi:hypothetical protein